MPTSAMTVRAAPNQSRSNASPSNVIRQSPGRPTASQPHPTQPDAKGAPANRPPRLTAPAGSFNRSAPRVAGGPRAAAGDRQGPKPEPKILFQRFFKSVGPRTYAAQVKEASNGNHFLVLTEGKRDDKTGELRKLRLFLFSEDFAEFFKMFADTERFIAEHPVSAEVLKKRQQFWKKQNSKGVAER